MAYAAWSVSFGEQPTASKWNILGTNDASFADGTGIAAAAILGTHLDANVGAGWITANETWTYASASTFTISGDKTAKYSVGMRIKLTQTSVKYFIITAISYSAPNTTVTVDGGGVYTVANAAISANFYTSGIVAQGFDLGKFLNGLVKHRQGGTSGDGAWNTNGTNNTNVSPKNVKVQVGTTTSGGGGIATITFPEAFTQAPLVFVTPIAGSNGFWAQLDSAASATQATITCWSATGTLALNKALQWIAIGQ